MNLNTNQQHKFQVNTVNHNPYNVKDPLSIRAYFKADTGKIELFDFYQLASTQNIGLLQTVFIDNSKNDGNFNLLCEATNQTIICRTGEQGYFPILTTKESKFKAWHNGTGIKDIPVQFLNYIISQGNW